MKRVLVTGGSRGLGLEICRRLLAADYAVITAARCHTPELQSLERQFPERIQVHQVDLARRSGIKQLGRAANLLDGIDGFVANAAVGSDGLLTLMPEKELRACVELNLVSTMLLAREVIKGMLARGGSIVFVSSIAAKTGFSGLSVYSATKGGLLSFSRAIAREYATKRIRANCILPGFFASQMTEGLDRESRRRIRRRTPRQKQVTPTEIANAVCYLLSDAASSITGTELVIDAGP